MESVVSKLQETGQHVAKKGDALFVRTRNAGEAFLGEVRGAGLDLVGLVRTEAKGWRRYLTSRVTRVETDVRAVLAPRAFERELLVRVDGTLRAIDAKVRARIAALEGRPAKGGARRKANGKATTTSGASRPAAKGKGAPKVAASGLAGTASVRH